MYPLALRSAGSPPMTTMCTIVLRSARAFSTSSSSGAATISATASVFAATWASSAREKSGDVGAAIAPSLMTAKLAARAGGGAQEAPVLPLDAEPLERRAELVDGGLEGLVGDLLVFEEDRHPVAAAGLDVPVDQLLRRVQLLRIALVLGQAVDPLRPELLRGQVFGRNLSHDHLPNRPNVVRISELAVRRSTFHSPEEDPLSCICCRFLEELFQVISPISILILTFI